jgi:DNA-binding CsgD family transcriptional regulator
MDVFESPTAADQAGVGAGGLLERDAEQAVLSEAVAAAGDGAGSVAVVDGPAGIGKSRLLSHATADGRAAGMRVFAARGIEFERAIPFGVAGELFASYLAEADSRERERLLGGHAGLAASLFDATARAPEDAQAFVRGLYWLTVNLTLAPAAESDIRPSIIVIDDAQWCDRPSLGFLTYLAARVEELPIALVLAARSDEAPSSAAMLAAIRDRAGHRVLRPASLTGAAVAQMVQAELPDAESSFVQACARVSGGNPFLARELVRALAADQVAPTADSVPAVERLVPESVLQSVLVRLGRLPEPAQRLADACAVLADGSRLRHAAALAGLDPETAERAADELAAAHILELGEPLRFGHPLIATAVHSDLPAFARARGHRRASELLAADGAPVDVVAAHLLMSTPNSDGPTVAVLREAAGRALAGGDPAAAVRLLERAVAEPPPADQRVEVLLELAAAAVQHGDPNAGRHITASLALQPDHASKVRGLVALARLRLQQGDHADSARLVQEVLDQLDPDDPLAQELIVDELTASAFRAPLRARADARIARFLDAARAGRTPEHPGLLAHLTLHLALTGEAPERVRTLAERATAAHALVDPASHGILAGIVVQALVCVDELVAAQDVADRALQASRRSGSLLAYASASYHRALPRYHRGALSDALADLDQALTASREGWDGAEGWIGALQAHIHLEAGDGEAARDALALASSAPAESLDQPIVLFAHACLALAAGDAAAALTGAEEVGRLLADGFGIDHPGFVPWRDTAAAAAAALGDLPYAQELARAGLERARRYGVPRPIGLALRTSALIDGGAQATELLDDAVRMLQASPSKLSLAHALVDQGAHLRRAGKRTAAQPPLRQGLELADHMGATPLSNTAREELRATGARPRRAAYTGVDALTPSERRVAQLAADGLTTPQIAQALFVTPKTIQTHLAHTYRKLDITSRRDLPATLRGRSAT